MSYNDDKREFSQTLNDLIEKQAGATIDILNLEHQACLKYGFGKLTIKRELEKYENLGLIKIDFKKNTFSILKKSEK